MDISQSSSEAKDALDALPSEAAIQLQRKRIPVELHYTHKKGHGYKLAEQAVAQCVETVAVCGGDGTLCEVVPALLDTPTTLGLLPFGTANDFARGLGVPRTLSKAVSVLVEGRVVSTDVEVRDVTPPLPPMI